MWYLQQNFCTEYYWRTKRHGWLIILPNPTKRLKNACSKQGALYAPSYALNENPKIIPFYILYKNPTYIQSDTLYENPTNFPLHIFYENPTNISSHIPYEIPTKGGERGVSWKGKSHKM